MSAYLSFCGKLLPQEKFTLSPDNRSFRYGDGFFETMRMSKGIIPLADYHFERMMTSLQTLRFDSSQINVSQIHENILELTSANGHQQSARIRLTFYRGDGGLHDAVASKPGFIIQSWKLEPPPDFNPNGLIIDIYSQARKTADAFSAIKSNNYLPYVMGALYAKEHKLDDCLLLNAWDRIADSTIANVFVINGENIKTPALVEGSVAGVMRRFLLEKCREHGYAIEEGVISPAELQQASEVFLTNAVRGIQWVKQAGASTYTNNISYKLHQQFVRPLHQL